MNGAVLGSRDRRTLILGAVGVGMLLLVSRGLPAWGGWVADAREAAAEKRDEAARAEALTRAFPAMRDSLAARKGRFLALAPTLLTGGSVNAASAELASLVSSAATEAGVTVGAVQLRTREPLPGDAGRRPSDQTGARHGSASAPVFVRIRIESDVTGDIEGISDFLLALERGPLRLAIRDLTITQSDAAGVPGRAEVLHATLAVEGLALAAGEDRTDRFDGKGR